MWWEYYSNTGNDERIEDTRINTCTLMSGCLNEWMDELKEREEIEQGEGEEGEGKDADADEVEEEEEIEGKKKIEQPSQKKKNV